MGNYTHLSIEDRETFYALRQQGLGISRIAKQLGRHRSTLYRELASCTDKGLYSPHEAHTAAMTTRKLKRKCKIERSSTLRQYVVSKLRLGWSPEQIAGRLKRKKSKHCICHETIYRFIYREKSNKLFRCLAYKKPKRRRQFAREKQECRYGNKRIITKRAKYVDKRERVGHWEGDGIEYKGSKSKIVTSLVERKTKVTFLIKNPNKCTDSVMNAIMQKLMLGPKKVCNTITFDQGGEFANFAVLEKNLKCKVFYCHKHSPWEKGTNENTNGRVRRFLPRKKNIDQITQEQLDEVSRSMNNTPRKCLAYRTPKELFLQHYKQDCRTWF